MRCINASITCKNVPPLKLTSYTMLTYCTVHYVVHLWTLYTWQNTNYIGSNCYRTLIQYKTGLTLFAWFFLVTMQYYALIDVSFSYYALIGVCFQQQTMLWLVVSITHYALLGGLLTYFALIGGFYTILFFDWWFL